uniref:Uncharacterized protein n=2 Tax=Lygus hesperus TaxID=30085 RepID=A0A0A9Y0M8_LYGHE
MNFELEHPLMFIKDLDAPTRSRRRGRGRGRGRRFSGGSSNSKPSRVSPANRRGRPPLNHSIMTRSQSLKLVSEDLYLSDSNSEGEQENVILRRSRRTRSLPPTHEPEVSGEENISGATSLIDDLYLSSNSSDSSSVSSPTSEITGPSDTDSEDLSPSRRRALPESLTGTLEGDSYFFLRRKTDPAVYDDFKTISFTEDSTLVFNRFKLLCRDYSADQACLMFAEKFKSYPTKKSISLLQNFYVLFKKERFLSKDMEPEVMFGSIVLSLVYHWYAKELHGVNVKLLNLLASCHIDPLRLRRFCKPGNNVLKSVALSNETEIAVICCETYSATNEMKHCIKFLLRALGKLLEEHSMSELEYLLPLIKRIFNQLFDTQATKPLALLFCYILDIQYNLEYPIDISLYYERVLALLVANTIKDKSCYKQAWDVFDTVDYWCYAEASGLAYRGLLLAGALRKEKSFRLQRLVEMCINTLAYPEHDSSEWVITLNSSMTKMEMQIYLIYCLREYLEDIWRGYLKMCSTFLTIEVLQVPNLTRDYIYPVHPKLREVDHSVSGAIHRLKEVLLHYMKNSEDDIHQHDETKLTMFGPVVVNLFKKVLKMEKIERDPENCALCFRT